MTVDLWSVTINRFRKTSEDTYNSFTAYVKARNSTEALKIAKDYCDFQSIQSNYSFDPVCYSSQIQKKTYKLNDLNDFYLRIWFSKQFCLKPVPGFTIHHVIEHILKVCKNNIQFLEDRKAWMLGAANSLYRKKQFNKSCNQIVLHDYGMISLHQIELSLKDYKENIKMQNRNLSRIYKIINNQFSKKDIQRYQKCKSLLKEENIFVNIGGLEEISED